MRLEAGRAPRSAQTSFEIHLPTFNSVRVTNIRNKKVRHIMYSVEKLRVCNIGWNWNVPVVPRRDLIDLTKLSHRSVTRFGFTRHWKLDVEWDATLLRHALCEWPKQTNWRSAWQPAAPPRTRRWHILLFSNVVLLGDRTIIWTCDYMILWYPISAAVCPWKAGAGGWMNAFLHLIMGKYRIN